jgi:ABC-type glycerol-3-phosphate transport system permease component
MTRRGNNILLHLVLLLIAGMTLVPFAFVINNSLRTNTEQNHSFFGMPKSVYLDGYRFAWQTLRPYVVNSLLVCAGTVAGVVLVASISGYVFARYRFPGHRLLFLAILSFMMIPGILTLVPSFLLVKKLGMLNSLWVLIIPYVAGGQVVAIFLFKGFFDGLPNELFESARLDGAGHLRLYWHIVLPMSKQIIAVVAIINTLGAWNNFLWPFITNSDDEYHVVASGLYVMSQSAVAQNYPAMYAAYVLSSLPLLVLFVYATRPFMAGLTSGAFKA